MRYLAATPVAGLAVVVGAPSTDGGPLMDVINSVASLPTPVIGLGVLGVAAGAASAVYGIQRLRTPEEAQGFARPRAVRRAMGRKQLLQRRHVLRPSLAKTLPRDIPTEALGAYLGKAKYGGGEVFAAIEDPILMISPTGGGKTAWLGSRVLDAPGPVIATGTRYDIVDLTEAHRRTFGTTDTFNPRGLAGEESSVAWDPVIDSDDPATAMRRAALLLKGSTGTEGTENAGFWQGSSFKILKSFLWAAAVADLSLLEVATWCKHPTRTTALDIFEQFEAVAPAGWADDLKQAQQVKGKPTTTENVFHTLALTFSFLSDPRMIEMIKRAHTNAAFDIDAFLSGRNTLYLIGEDQEIGGVGPLFTCLTGEIYERAGILATYNPGGRLDPPLRKVLDESALICPVPLERWTSDSRGKGIQLLIAAQSLAQIYERWGKYGGQTIWDNCTKMILGGGSVVENLRPISDLCGERRETTINESYGPNGTSRTRVHRMVPVMTPQDIKDLPQFHALVLRRSLGPVIVTYRPVWERPEVKATRTAVDKNVASRRTRGLKAEAEAVEARRRQRVPAQATPADSVAAPVMASVAPHSSPAVVIPPMPMHEPPAAPVDPAGEDEYGELGAF